MSTWGTAHPGEFSDESGFWWSAPVSKLASKSQQVTREWMSKGKPWDKKGFFFFSTICLDLINLVFSQAQYLSEAVWSLLCVGTVSSRVIYIYPEMDEMLCPWLCVWERGVNPLEKLFVPANTFNMHITTSLISRSISEMIMNNTFAWQGLCVCEDFSACFLQVSPPFRGTEMPTSPSTSRMRLPAQLIPSTRPRTANQESGHTESSRQWTVLCCPLTFNAALLCLVLVPHVFCAAALRRHWIDWW